MRARTAIAWTAHRVRLTAIGWGLTTVLACVALSACTSGPTTPSSSGTVFSPTASATASGSTSAGASESASSPASESPSPGESPTPSPSPSPSPSYSPSYSPYPTTAPVTGGGGTAGFQDAGLAVLGGAAIVAGLGGIAYRRRIIRRR